MNPPTIVSSSHINAPRSSSDHSRFEKETTSAFESINSSPKASFNQSMCAPASCAAISPTLHPVAPNSLLQHLRTDISFNDIKDPFSRSSGFSRSLNPDLFIIDSAITIDDTPDGIFSFNPNSSTTNSNTIEMSFPAHLFEPTPIGPSVRVSSPVHSSDEGRLDPMDSQTPALYTSRGVGESTCSATPMNENNKRELHLSDPNADESPKKKRSKRNSPSDKAPLYRPYQEMQWTEQFQELLNFKAQNGHCLVQHTSHCASSLSRWVKRQRYQYKLKQENKVSTLSDERVTQLEEAGFVWDSHAVVWEERLVELEQYKKERGDCNVPSQYPENPKLAIWVKCQRRQYRKFCHGEGSSMTSERFGKLDKMGFTWQLRGLKKKDSLGFNFM
ncbi:MAG: hypothetical protein SGBAC_007485 [Bacillariaceae sp.]